MAPMIDNYNDPSTALGSFCSWQMTQREDGSRESSLSAFCGNYTTIT